MSDPARLLALFAVLAVAFSGSVLAGDPPKKAPAKAAPASPAPAPTDPPRAPPALTPLVRVDASSWDAQILKPRKGKVVLVNFWATWCIPCVRELPDLQGAHQRFDAARVDVVLVSSDAGKRVDERVRARLLELGIAYKSYVQSPDDIDKFIAYIDKDWGGELPFTVVYGVDGKPALVLRGAQTQESFADAIRKVLEAPKKG